MFRGSLDWTWDTKGQFIRPRCIGVARSRTLDILILTLKRILPRLPYVFHVRHETGDTYLRLTVYVTKLGTVIQK
jgi:hypothetical protein